VAVRKLLYKPVGLLVGAGAGVVAGFVFKKVWQVASGQDDAPDALDQDRDWIEILVAAALQGAIFAVVKAVLDRGSAAGVRRLTGAWPG
jgi:hypothetical protein